MMPASVRGPSRRIALQGITLTTIEGREDQAYSLIISEVIKSAHVNMLIDGVSEMTLVFYDEGHQFFYSNWTGGGVFFPRGAIVRWALNDEEYLEFIVTGREATNVDETTVTARDRVATKLRSVVGPLSVANATPPQAVATMVQMWNAGDNISVQVMGEPMASIPDLTLYGTETGVEPEDLWTGAERWSTESVPPLGLMLFSARGRVWYARPSWIVDHMDSITIEKDGDLAQHALLSPPRFRDSVDSKWDEKTVELSALMELGKELTPGTVLDLSGYGDSFSGRYWVTSADGDVDDTATWTVQAATPPTDERYMLKLLGMLYNPYTITPQNQVAGSVNSDDGDQDTILRTIREVESNNNYDEHHRFDEMGRKKGADTASGAYQFTHDTWHGLGGTTDEAYQASVAEQDRIAKKNVANFWKPGQDLRRVPKGWAGDPNAPDDKKMPESTPGSNNGLTFGKYADKWMAVYRRLSASTTPPATSIPTDGSANTAGFTPAFAAALSSMFASAKAENGINYQVISGYRTQAEQDVLFAAAVKKYGSEAAARHHVAKYSNHTKGLAADIGIRGVSLVTPHPGVTPSDLFTASEWAHANAHRFGLNFPMSWEPWHIEKNGTRD